MTLHSTLYYMAPNSVVQDRLILNQAKLNVSAHNDFNLTKRCRHYVAPNAVAMTLHSTLYDVAPNSVVQDRLILNQAKLNISGHNDFNLTNRAQICIINVTTKRSDNLCQSSLSSFRTMPFPR